MHRAASVLLALTLSGLAGAAEAPTSREFKLLLQGERFASWEDGAGAYWALVRQVAWAQGVDVRALPWEARARQVVFLDTPDHALRAAGYSLRVRTDQIGRDQRLDEVSEYALKYRALSLEGAAAGDLRTRRFPADRELEEDVSYAPAAVGHIKTVYAARTLIETDWSVRPRLGAWARYFPGLLELGIPPETAVGPVNGVVVHEVKVSPARLDFGGGVVAKLDLTLWTDQQDRPMIGEVSFDHALPVEPWAEQLAVDFFTALAEESDGWLETSATKTAFTYGAVERP
ncbi:MAG: hypothetical protein JXX28_19050 [Deltaproteobacteria bacterium]|nr:hypothetical protein [Deltaproteobacteria bacterium]